MIYLYADYLARKVNVVAQGVHASWQLFADHALFVKDIPHNEYTFLGYVDNDAELRALLDEHEEALCSA